MNIAIQGIQGSFHHMVADAFFGTGARLTECNSFNEIPKLIIKDSVDAGIMAMENSNIGDISSNYALIDKYDLNIQGEFFLPMRHNLMALNGQDIYDIKEVWSHPIAIQDCRRFFRYHPHIRISEERDTALAAKRISEEKIEGVAAIASKKAAEIYNLNIIKDNIQTDDLNITRFFVLTKKREHKPEDYLNNKATLRFTTHFKVDHLAEILNICVAHNLQLTKIQSLPVKSKSWSYAFLFDILFSDYHEYCKALLKLQERVASLKILGEYTESKLDIAKIESES